MELTPEDLEQLGNKLCELYIQHRRINRKFYTLSESNRKLIYRLARLLAEKDIDGPDYMRWAYEFFSRHTPEVFVNQITSPKTVNIYLEREPTSPDVLESQLRLKLNIQNNVIDTELRLGRDLSDILTDSTLAIGQVLRYVFACQSGLDDLAEKFRRGSELEIRLNPLYRKILGDKLPPE